MPSSTPAQIVEKIKSRIIVGAGGCWEWTGEKTSMDGFKYGRIGIMGKKRLAHRVSYETFIGAIPDGMNVCHRCDNPPCVNPSHLFIGTDADNMGDRKAKGRYSNQEKGEARYNAKLNAASVVEIRRRLAERSQPILHMAREFGVSRMAIYMIKDNRRWKHVAQ